MIAESSVTAAPLNHFLIICDDASYKKVIANIMPREKRVEKYTDQWKDPPLTPGAQPDRQASQAGGAKTFNPVCQNMAVPSALKKWNARITERTIFIRVPVMNPMNEPRPARKASFDFFP